MIDPKIAEQLQWGPLPRLPIHIILTDETDGTEWLFTHNDTHLVLSTEVAVHKHGGTFRPPAFSGVYLTPLSGRSVKITVRSGRLVQADVPASEAIVGPRIITRRGLNRAWKELFIPTTWLEDTRLSWRDGV